MLYQTWLKGVYLLKWEKPRILELKRLTVLALFRRLRLSTPYVPGLWSETHVAANDYNTAPYYISGRDNKR